jgi:hypothetical protein
MMRRCIHYVAGGHRIENWYVIDPFDDVLLQKAALESKIALLQIRNEDNIVVRPERNSAMLLFTFLESNFHLNQAIEDAVCPIFRTLRNEDQRPPAIGAIYFFELDPFRQARRANRVMAGKGGLCAGFEANNTFHASYLSPPPPFFAGRN